MWFAGLLRLVPFREDYKYRTASFWIYFKILFSCVCHLEFMSGPLYLKFRNKIQCKIFVIQSVCILRSITESDLTLLEIRMLEHNFS